MPTKKKLQSFFMRFYNTTKEQREEFIKIVRKRHPSIVKVTEGPLTLSVNLMLPGNGVEVSFFAPNIQVIKDDKELAAMYEKAACPGVEGKLEIRKPGDLSFRV